MSVLRRVKLRTPDGTESIEYPLGVEAKNVEVANQENLSQRLVRIDEDLEKNEEEIAAIKEEQTTQNENISKNADEITNLKNENSYLQNVVKQAFTETSASGTELTINNTIEARMEMKLNGNTSQNGEPTPATPQDIEVVTGNNKIIVSGKNLLPPDNNTSTTINGGDYEPYVGRQDFPISLGSLELCKIGDYQDYIYKKDEKWYKHKKVEKLILNGSNYVFYLNESTKLPNPTYHRFITFFSQNGLNSGIVNCYSNKFKNTTGNELWNNDISGIAQSQTQIIIRTNKASNDNEIKTWLSQNNLTGYFSLTTPTEEEITDTTLISQLNELEKAVSKKGTTIIFQNNDDLPFNLDVIALTK